MAITYYDADPQFCPPCRAKRVRIERILDEGLGGAKTYACVNPECQLFTDLSKIETWREIAGKGDAEPNFETEGSLLGE